MIEDCRRVGFEVKRLDHLMSRCIEAGVKAEGIDEITLMNGWIMRYLYENKGNDVFQKDLEKHFSIGRSTVTGIIKLMEKKDLIRREAVEHDARLKKVILTEKGIEAHEKIEEMITRMNQQMIEGIAEEELEVFLCVIKKLRENAENIKLQATDRKNGWDARMQAADNKNAKQG